MGMLLELEDINPETVETGYCRTPFLWAAQGGHAGILGVLWNKLISILTPGFNSETAFELAACRGHTGVLQLPSEPEPSVSNRFRGGGNCRVVDSTIRRQL